MRRSRPSRVHRRPGRSSRPIIFLSFIFPALLATKTARARCTDPATSACIDSDSLWPHAGPSYFVGVGGTRTVAPGYLGFGLFATYLSRPVVLHVPSPAPAGTDLKAVDNQVDATFLFSYGVAKRLQLDLELPMTLIQSGSGVSGITGGTSLHDTAMRDLRFGLAYALLPAERDPGMDKEEPSPLSLLGRFVVTAPTGDTGQFAGGKSAVFSPSLSAEARFGRFFAGAELGLRIRETTEFVGARVGTQGYAALGFGYDLLAHDRLSLTGEARALPVFAEQHDLVQGAGGFASVGNGRHIVPAEWTAGVRSAPFPEADIAFQLSGGGPIAFNDPPAITVPRFRFSLGIVYAPRSPSTSPPSSPAAP